MKKQLAEYFKLMSAMGILPGLQAGLTKNFASKDFSVKVPGLPKRTKIRKGSSDWKAFKQVFIWKEYDYPLSSTPGTILDAGANVGYASLWFTQLFPHAQIVSLEPESSNFEMLKINTSDYPNVHPIKAGLWGRSCFLKITHPDWGNWGFRTEETETEIEGSVRALNVKEIMDTYGWETIDLLKMDIEGAELNVFATGADAWLPKVKIMFLELHDNVNRDCSKNVFKALLKHDFSVDITGENIILFNNKYL
jgi:FkbM family methyltransferase